MVKEPPRGDLDPRLEVLREYLLNKPHTSDDFPFGPQAMVFRVAGKIFAIMPWEENPISISLKCDPDRAVELREQHPAITGAWHMDKKHWNGVKMDDSVDLDLVRELIDHSYDLIVASLPKKVREELDWD
jgi:predicted DNA-binding protein (MmcQ/YjbR family)